METLNKYSIVNGKVYKRGNATLCPKMPPLYSPGSMAGTMNVTLRPCEVACPMCNVHIGALGEEDAKNNVEKHYIQITCGSHPIFEYIDEPTMDAQKSKLASI